LWFRVRSFYQQVKWMRNFLKGLTCPCPHSYAPPFANSEKFHVGCPSRLPCTPVQESSQLKTLYY
jgi:hypothetical protein